MSDDGELQPAGYQQLTDEDPSPSPPASPEPEVRSPEQKELLKKKLVRFYSQYNPTMLEGDHIDKMIELKVSDEVLFRKLFEKYVHETESSDDDYQEHPQLVGDEPKKKVFKKRTVRPKGGHTLAKKYSGYTMALLIPVSITMLIVVWAVTNFTPISEVSEHQPLLLSYHEKSTDSGGTKFAGALRNALIIVGFFVLVTTIMFLLYKYRCMKVIAGWLITSSAMILYLMGWIWFDLFCVKYQIPYDSISCAIIMWNFGTVGVICIYFRGHPKMTQAYLIATSSIMAWFLSRLPPYTTFVLLVAVALYDIAAVLCPKGPLKALVEESQKRDETIPGLIYESKSYKLGLGDFVFYSVLVGRAAVYDYLTWVTCFLAVLTGLCTTLCCLGFFKRALPALPISILLGVATYFTTRYLLVPYATRITVLGVYI